MKLIAWSYLWTDLPTRLALIGLLIAVIYLAIFVPYVARHYTRVPGGRWTTWQRASRPALPLEQEEAA